MKMIDTLETIKWAEKEFGSLHSGGRCNRRDIMICVKKGLAESIGYSESVDGDGFTIEPVRTREGFILTQSGKELLIPTIDTQ